MTGLRALAPPAEQAHGAIVALSLWVGEVSLPVAVVTPPRPDGSNRVRISVVAETGPTRLPGEGDLRNDRGHVLPVSIEWSAGLPGSRVTHRLAFTADEGAAFDWDG